MVCAGRPGPGKPNLWVIARQHPGESMAEWCAPAAPIARCLCAQAALVHASAAHSQSRVTGLPPLGPVTRQRCCLWQGSCRSPVSCVCRFVEGFLRRLLDPHDALARKARTLACFYVVRCARPGPACLCAARAMHAQVLPSTCCRSCTTLPTLHALGRDSRVRCCRRMPLLTLTVSPTRCPT